MLYIFYFEVAGGKTPKEIQESLPEGVQDSIQREFGGFIAMTSPVSDTRCVLVTDFDVTSLLQASELRVENLEKLLNGGEIKPGDYLCDKPGFQIRVSGN